MRRSPALVLAGLFLFVPPTHAQSVFDARLKERFPTATSGRVQEFLTKLQDTLRRDDKAAACRLVRYPLLRGTLGPVNNASDCAARFNDVFDAEVIHAVAAQSADELYIGYNELGVGNGELWIGAADDGRLLVRSTTPQLFRESWEQSRPQKGNVLMAGHTTAYRVQVAVTARGTLRLRLWPVKSDPVAEPVVEVTSALETAAGSGPCSYAIWSFRSNHTRFNVEQLGCVAQSNRPPRGAVGRFEIVAPGREAVREFCVKH
jgi:hypothetical protein